MYLRLTIDVLAVVVVCCFWFKEKLYYFYSHQKMGN